MGIQRALSQFLPLWLLNSYHKFLRDGGDTLLVHDLALSSDSIVVDVGGYLGDYSAEIHKVYSPNIFIIEPVSEFYLHLLNRFDTHKNIQILPWALGNDSYLSWLNVQGDSTSAFRPGVPTQILYQPTDLLFEKFGERHVDVLCMNIEGGEYELLEILIEKLQIRRIQILFVQFHRLPTIPIERYVSIQSRLSDSHHLTFDYPYIWQRWDLKVF